jgi:hypothetical protein
MIELQFLVVFRNSGRAIISLRSTAETERRARGWLSRGRAKAERAARRRLSGAAAESESTRCRRWGAAKSGRLRRGSETGRGSSR